MGNKVWHMVTIATEEQNVKIYPTDLYDGIIVATEERSGTSSYAKLYLNEDEMEMLIIKMTEMMEYVKQK
jgi:hypothetical protein